MAGPVIRPWDTLFPTGTPIDVTQMTPEEYQYYFPYGDNPNLAATNTLQALGVNPSAGNPVAAFLDELPGRLARQWSDQQLLNNNILGTATAPGQENAVLAAMRGGQGSQFNGMNAVRAFLGSAGQALAAPAATRNAGQEAFASKYADPAAAFGFITNALAGNVAPGLLGNASAINRLQGNLYQQFQNAANPQQSFLQFLLGKFNPAT